MAGQLLQLSIDFSDIDVARTKMGEVDKRSRTFRDVRDFLGEEADAVVEALKEAAPVAEWRPGRESPGRLRSNIHAGTPEIENDIISVPILAFQRIKYTRPPGIDPHFVPAQARDLANEEPVSFYWNKLGKWIHATQVYSGGLEGGYHPDTDWVEDVLTGLEETIGSRWAVTVKEMMVNA